MVFLQADPITLIRPCPSSSRQNRIRIPKPTLEHHRQRTGAGLHQLTLVQTQSHLNHRTSYPGSNHAHLVHTFSYIGVAANGQLCISHALFVFC
jgi:hypothetical protein